MKSKLSKLLPKNHLVRGTMVLVSGTVGAQLLAILASPIITRLYTPEDFGLLAFYLGVLSLFTVIASLRYELAITLPSNNADAISLVKLCIIIVLLVTLLSTGFIFIFKNELAERLNQPSLENYLLFLPLGVLAIGLYQVFYYWSLRNKSFSTVAKTKVTQSLGGVLIQLTLFKFGALTLILGQVVSQMLGVRILAKSLVYKNEFKKWSFVELKSIGQRYKRFPIYSTWEGFVNSAGASLPPLLFAVFFSASTAGLYALSHRILSMPMSLIGGAVGNVFISNAAEALRENKLTELFSLVYSKLVMIIVPIILILIFEASNLFEFAFGLEWREAGNMARYMAPWLGIVFVASPLSTLFSVLEKQQLGMLFQLVMFFFRVVSISLGVHYESVYLAILFFSLFGFLCWSVFIIWGCLQTKNKLRILVKPLIVSFFYGLIIVSPSWVSTLFLGVKVPWLLIVLTMGSMALLYYIKLLKGAYR